MCRRLNRRQKAPRKRPGLVDEKKKERKKEGRKAWISIFE
jgi:hypothetical protein